jgi:hypothetical protein
MKRNSPFMKTKMYPTDLKNPEEVIKFVSNNPAGYVPNMVIVYSVGDKRHHHMTMLFRIVATQDVRLVLELYNWIKNNWGDTLKVEFEDEADFKSHIYPDATILRVNPLLDQKLIDEWSSLIQIISGYSWKPHITFKEGKPFDISELKLELWVGYMRQDLILSNGKSIYTLISPLHKEVKNFISSD